MLWIINLIDADYQKEKVNISLIIKNLVSQNKDIIKNKKITIKNNIQQSDIFKVINKQHLELCVWNILKNAIKYSLKNSIINIEYQNNEITIQDYGIWIEKKNLKNIFNSYFRENYSQQEWYWLWLALVKKITDMNSWKIDIISEKNTGTIVKIKID
jgi:signal transduction histidine kinase